MEIDLVMTFLDQIVRPLLQTAAAEREQQKSISHGLQFVKLQKKTCLQLIPHSNATDFLKKRSRSKPCPQYQGPQTTDIKNCIQAARKRARRVNSSGVLGRPIPEYNFDKI